MKAIVPCTADAVTAALVEAALKKAESAGQDAAAAFLKTTKCDAHGHILDMCGFAYVRTYRSDPAVTAALLQLKLATPMVESGGYELHCFDFKISDQSISIHEAAAEAAADVLTKELGQKFYMWSRLD
jgi:hypothetical protein